MQDNHGPGTQVLVHPRLVRLTHWVNALCIIIMVKSGWRIFNASPLFDFRFSRAITLGGWLGGGLLWHFAAMWLAILAGCSTLELPKSMPWPLFAPPCTKRCKTWAGWHRIRARKGPFMC